MNNMRYIEDHRLISQCMSTPTIRMLYLKCGVCDDGDPDPEWHTISRVLSLHTQTFDSYTIPLPDKTAFPQLPATHTEAIAAGWRYTGQTHRYGAIVEDPDYGLISTTDFLMDDTNHSKTMIVSVLHPENKEMDEAFVAQFLPDMFKECKRKIALNKKREEKLSQ